MASQWPPSPRVEDEELALKNEITHNSELTNKKEAEEAPSRGTVDQNPIILDINRGAESKHDYTSSTDNEGESIRAQSSDDSYGPPTPPNSKAGGNKVHRSPKPDSTRSQSGKATPPPKASAEHKEEFTPRGRPNIPRIHTGLGSDLQGMITGQRRAPSPYAYAKPDAPSKSESYTRLSGNTFLSPEIIASNRPSLETDGSKRPSSARPCSKQSSRNNSDDSTDTEKRRRHYSRRRSSRESFPEAQLSPDILRKERLHAEKESSYYAYTPSKSGDHSRVVSDAETSRRIEADDRRRRRLSKGSPCTSPAEESWSKSRSEFASGTEERSSKDSLFTSSAEEVRSHRGDSRREGEFQGRRSQRNSVSKKEIPRLELSGHQYSYHGAPTEEKRSGGKHSKLVNSVFDGRSYLEPSSLRSPRAMEEYLEKAFRDNKNRSHKESPDPSSGASPRASPPRSPPRTPRVEKRPKDYFSLRMSTPLHASEPVRPRAPSHGEGQHDHIKPLASLLAASAGVRAAPSLSRSSTSSIEVHSGGIHSKPTSGRRSRNSSPTREQRIPVSRPGYEHEKSEPKFIVDGERPISQPVSRSNSSSYHPPLSAASNRFNTSNPFPVSPVDGPRMNQRAHSYSSTNDYQHPRQPSSANSAQLHFGPTSTPHQAPLPTTPRLPRSPSSSEKSPSLYQLSDLPPCPRAKPEVGRYDWYTVIGMPQLDICPSCMTVLGASRFRDIFVPSTSKVPGQRVVCDFSRPWVRSAWTQVIKQRRSNLEIVYQIIRNSETTKPCPGKGSDVRAWYRLPDPDTGNYVPNFDACSECVRSVEIIFPQLRGIFRRSGALVQERTCDLNTQSRRFNGYMKLLDAAALQYDVERLQEPDIQPFAKHARKTARVRECVRDDMVLGQLWHFIPGLPEFTICEECFDLVVWPVIDQPVAGSVTRTLQLVLNTERSTGISCQLYSERMRKKFLEAVRYGDYEFLKQIALRRHEVERLLQEKHKILMYDMAMGKDKTTELQANIEEWRKWE